MDLSAESSRIKLLWVAPPGLNTTCAVKGFPTHFLYRLAYEQTHHLTISSLSENREKRRVTNMQRARRGTRVGEEGAFSFTIANRCKKGKGPCFTFYFPYFGPSDHIQMLICA